MSTPIELGPIGLGDSQSIRSEASTEQTSDRLVLSQQGLRTVAASDRETLLEGRRAFERGDDEQALACLGRLAGMGHEYADVHYMIGMLEERRGHLDQAINSLRQATRINPQYVEALLALASLHERRGDYDVSRGYAERASEGAASTAGQMDPTTRGKLANQQATLADALSEAGEKRDAIVAYRGALDRCPDFHDIRHRLGVALREAGLPFQAVQEFQRIVDHHPTMLDSQIQLGLTYYSLGRTADAISEWQSVIEANPRRDDARMYLRLVGQPDNEDAGAAIQPGVPRPSAAAAPPPPTNPGWAKRELSSAASSAAAADTPADLASINADIEIDFESGPSLDTGNDTGNIDGTGDTHLGVRPALDAGPSQEEDLHDFDELEALERLEGIPMPSADDLFTD